jgi:hypothetical protein
MYDIKKATFPSGTSINGQSVAFALGTPNHYTYFKKMKRLIYSVYVYEDINTIQLLDDEFILINKEFKMIDGKRSEYQQCVFVS